MTAKEQVTTELEGEREKTKVEHQKAKTARLALDSELNKYRLNNYLLDEEISQNIQTNTELALTLDDADRMRLLRHDKLRAASKKYLMASMMLVMVQYNRDTTQAASVSLPFLVCSLHPADTRSDLPDGLDSLQTTSLSSTSADALRLPQTSNVET